MPGGAVLNPDSAIPRQLSVCGGHNKVQREGFNGKVQRAGATESALSVDLSELRLLSRHLLKAAAHSGMPRWQDLPFVGLSRSANDATDYFQIPTGRVVEADHDLGA
jgi:K+ transporter